MKCQNKECRKSFSPKYSNIIYCSYECGKIIAKERNSKKLAIKKTTKTKEKTKTQYKDDLQILINKCIHIIDKGMNCITCDQQFKGKLQPQAGEGTACALALSVGAGLLPILCYAQLIF